jgi:gamma-glutamyl-gamma-aminobutyrate hydrolase PuuD
MRIAVSQRVDAWPERGERRDALDQRWAPLLEGLGLLPVPLPNGLRSPVAWAQALGIQGLLLSGGNSLADEPVQPDQAAERDRSEADLLDLAGALDWPVLGVCRGFQRLNAYLGGTLRALPGHVAVRHPLHRSGVAARWLAHLPDGLDVNSFHSQGFALADLAPSLQPVLQDAQGHVEAAEHRQRRWAGILWHPEREPALHDTDRHLLTRLFLDR